MDWVNRLSDANYDNLLYLYDAFPPYSIRAVGNAPISFSGPPDAYFFTCSAVVVEANAGVQTLGKLPTAGITCDHGHHHPVIMATL